MPVMRALLLVLVVGCGGVDRASVRWPAHRKDRDMRIESLEREVKQLEHQVYVLEQRASAPPTHEAAHEPDPAPPQS